MRKAARIWLLAGAQSLEQADLGSAFGDRDQHHVHDAHAGHRQRDRGDARQGQGHGLKDGPKDATIASWEMTVTSSARWRSASRSIDLLAGRVHVVSGGRTSTRMRKRELRLNMVSPVCTGTMTRSSMSKMPRERPGGRENAHDPEAPLADAHHLGRGESRCRRAPWRP